MALFFSFWFRKKTEGRDDGTHDDEEEELCAMKKR